MVFKYMMYINKPGDAPTCRRYLEFVRGRRLVIECYRKAHRRIWRVCHVGGWSPRRLETKAARPSPVLAISFTLLGANLGLMRRTISCRPNHLSDRAILKISVGAR